MRKLIVFTAVLAIAFLGNVAFALDVPVGERLSVKFDTAEGDQVYLATQDNAKRLYLGIDTAGKGIIHTSTMSSLAIMPYAGNVGIGTKGPAYKLHVQDGQLGVRFDTSAGDQLYLTSADNSKRLYLGIDTTNNKGMITTSSASYPLLIMPYGGNVGIGTQSPSAALDVVGDIYANDVYVDVDLDGDGIVETSVSVAEAIEALSQPGASGIARYKR